MTTATDRYARRLFCSTAAVSALLIVIALVAQRSFSFVHPVAVAVGCTFAIFNLVFYKHIVAVVLDSNSPASGLMTTVALLKLPLLAVLLFILTRQGEVVIGNVVAGSLVFIPGALLAAAGSAEVASNGGSSDTNS